ncbi:MAG: NAD(P)/FAD-dependent oxidoreductase [Flavobacteriaceae bacterium]
MFDVIIVGGGAAGFYGALHIARGNPKLKIAILEKGRNVLAKVKVSGGGRCNVTNTIFEPDLLAGYYPRGSKELLGPFYTHSSNDTVSFFEEHGIPLKTEKDGRIFPITNNSKTVIDFFLREATKSGIQIIKNSAVLGIVPPLKKNETSDRLWKIESARKTYSAKTVLITTGNNAKIWRMLGQIGHNIVQPVPSLFSFNIKDKRISGLQGISTNARVTIVKKKFTSKEITVGLKSDLRSKQQLKAEGPLLITHWGLSGPAVLKLSAWGARELFEYGYRFRIKVNWVPDYHQNSVPDLLRQVKSVEGKKTVYRTNAVDIPRKLWGKLVRASGVDPTATWSQMSTADIDRLAFMLSSSEFTVEGKSTNKEEFVTAGGVDLKQINFKTFGSKLHPNLYLAGEVLNIDGITGGFNFQSAWTGSYIAALAIASTSQ